MKLYHLESNKCDPGILFYKTTIEVDVLARFNYIGDSIKLTKYHITKVRGQSPLIAIDNKTYFWCEQCKEEVLFKNAGFRCDECKVLKAVSEINSLGLTLVLCNSCYRKNPKYQDFAGFLPKLNNDAMRKEAEAFQVIDNDDLLPYPPPIRGARVRNMPNIPNIQPIPIAFVPEEERLREREENVMEQERIEMERQQRLRERLRERD